ncbi:hypothetical protein ACFVAJ_17915 [Agromyces sp. NPDC057679]|uniref:hypothetical protein n=1 Tax=Agromyces sp. NPDC057679 TaxID=3346207 RepID=UPI00366BF800
MTAETIRDALEEAGIPEQEAARLAARPQLTQPFGRRYHPVTERTVARYVQYWRSGSLLPFSVWAISYDRGARLARDIESRGDVFRRMS